MAKSLSVAHASLLFLRPKVTPPYSTLFFSLPPRSFNSKHLRRRFLPLSSSFSTTATPYPLQYDMIVSRPTESSLAQTRRRPPRLANSRAAELPESESMEEPATSSDGGLEGWIDRKLSSGEADLDGSEMDKSKRKYYRKRRKRMYGSDSSDDDRGDGQRFVELKPEVVELRTLHKKEEELYFYDAFAYPWEKEKHYRMVYQLEKKYFPDHCLDKAFVQPGESNANVSASLKGDRKVTGSVGKKDVVGKDGDEKGLVFFEGEEGDVESVKDAKRDISEKKVAEFFKCLKKAPDKDAQVASAEPYILTRSSELPPRWDGPSGTVVLVNKPKGETWT